MSLSRARRCRSTRNWSSIRISSTTCCHTCRFEAATRASRVRNIFTNTMSQSAPGTGPVGRGFAGGHGAQALLPEGSLEVCDQGSAQRSWVSRGLCSTAHPCSRSLASKLAVRPAIKAGRPLASTPLAGGPQAEVGIPAGRLLDGTHLSIIVEGLGSVAALMCHLASPEAFEVMVLLQW